MPEKAREYLLVPAGGSGMGLGHLSRSIRLARSLGAKVTFFTGYMDKEACQLLARELSAWKRGAPRMKARLGEKDIYDLVVLDKRSTSLAELEGFDRHGPVLCVDEGGDARQRAAYLIDTFPPFRARDEANVHSLCLLDPPGKRRRAGAKGIRKVLVSFGGEDRARLSERLLETLIGKGSFRPAQLTVVHGPLFGRREWPEGVAVVRGSKALGALIGSHDVVFTHFGLTAFEALSMGVPAILLNPSRYHRRLSRGAGFPEIGIGRPSEARLARLLADPGRLRARALSLRAALSDDGSKDAAALLASLSFSHDSSCPTCGSTLTEVVGRFADRTYRHCSRCGIEHLESFAAGKKRYDARYFSKEYKAQYGRTYLQDFEQIKQSSRERVRVIRSLLGDSTPGTIVDVGCAFGPFLDALRDQGLEGFGVDVALEPVRYLKAALGIPALQADFRSVARGSLPSGISGITLWYTLEHFERAGEILRKAYEFLDPGGVFAFSTPNGRGISALKNKRAFLMASPRDHFIIFSPRKLKGLLSMYGFDLRKVRVTGHHPERFPGMLGKLALGSPLFARAVTGASRLLRLGDTFEAYAVRDP